MDHDRKFFDTFILILGAMLGLTVAIYFIANALADAYLTGQHLESPAAQQELEKRLAPMGEVRVAGEPGSTAPVPAPAQVAAAPAPQAAAKIDGKSIYQTACFACHATGAAGAPRLGDKADWGPRIAQGMDVLKQHALEGYVGSKGVMPPKGGRTDLSDAEIIAALEYMVGQNR